MNKTEKHSKIVSVIICLSVFLLFMLLYFVERRISPQLASILLYIAIMLLYSLPMLRIYYKIEDNPKRLLIRTLLAMLINIAIVAAMDLRKKPASIEVKETVTFFLAITYFTFFVNREE